MNIRESLSLLEATCRADKTLNSLVELAVHARSYPLNLVLSVLVEPDILPALDWTEVRDNPEPRNLLPIIRERIRPGLVEMQARIAAALQEFDKLSPTKDKK